MFFRLVFILVAFSSSCLAQESLRFNNLNETHGLSNKVVNCILQDWQGFMWIGTDEGLNRYDGRTFRTYELINPNSGSKATVINDLFLDSKGNVWVCTSSAGLFHLPHGAYNFKFLDLQEGNGQNLLCITEQQDGTFLVGADRFPMIRFNLDGTILPFTSDPNFFRHDLTYHFFDGPSKEVIAAPLGSPMVVFEDHKWTPVFGSFNQELAIPTTTGFAYNKNEAFYGGWDSRIFQHSLSQEQTEVFFDIDSLRKNDDEINCLEIKEDWLWVGSRRTGLHVIHTESKTHHHYRPSLWNATAIGSNAINCFFSDDEERVWIGTDQGVSVFDPLLFQFDVSYLPEALLSQKGTNAINCIYEDDSVIYIGSHGGLFIHQNDTITSYSDSFESLSVFSIARDQKNTLWIGTNQSIYSIDEGKRTLEPIQTYYSSTVFSQPSRLLFDLPSSRIVEITPVEINGASWILAGVYGYIMMALNVETRSASLISPYVVDHKGERIYDGLTEDILRDSKGNLWFVGHTRGILHAPLFPSTLNAEIYAPQGVESSSYFIEPSFADSTHILSKSIPGLPAKLQGSNLTEYADEQFYLTTYGHGLFDVKKMDGVWKALAMKTPHASLEGIQVDESGAIWIIASGGFDCYNPKTKKWTRFDSSDGFPSKGVQGDLYKLSNGDFLACGEGYLVRFNPTKLKKPEDTVPTVITALRILDQKQDSILNKENVELNFDQNFIEIEFSSLNFTNGHRNQFNYRLQGVDDQWVNAGTRNFASYSDLPPGNYRFEVVSINNGLKEGNQPATFSFVIAPPFWKSTPFLFSVFVLLSLLILLYLRYRIASFITRQQEQLVITLKAQEKERSRLAAELHDDLGTKMSTLKLYMNTLENVSQSSDKVANISRKAQQLIDGSITDLRSILSDLSPRLLFTHGLVTAIDNLVQHVQLSFEPTISFLKPSSHLRFEETTELAVYRIVQELLHNAMKHASDNNVNLSLAYENQLIVLTYSDDGVGFNEDHASSGYGIRNIKQRVQLLNGEATWGKVLPQQEGTTLRIQIPMKQRIQ